MIILRKWRKGTGWGARAKTKIEKKIETSEQHKKYMNTKTSRTFQRQQNQKGATKAKES